MVQGVLVIWNQAPAYERQTQDCELAHTSCTSTKPYAATSSAETTSQKHDQQATALRLKHPALTAGRNGGRSTLLLNLANWCIRFQISYETCSSIFSKSLYIRWIFKTTNHCFSNKKSVLLIFKMILKISTFRRNFTKIDRKKLFSQKCRYLPESK